MLAPCCTFRSDLVAMLPRLRSFAISLCRNHDYADDLVQDTVVAALLHQDKFANGTNLSAWLFSILKNKFRSGYRKGRREVEDPDEKMAKSVPFDDSPLKKIEVRQALQLVEQMPAVWREPLKMIADGSSYEEIAAELNEQLGTIKSRISRGRSHLESAE